MVKSPGPEIGRQRPESGAKTRQEQRNTGQMIRFVAGFVVGAVFCGMVLGALAILNPLERPDAPSAAPAQIGAPEGSAAVPEPQPVSAPAPAATASQQTAADPESSPEPVVAVEAEPAPDAAPAPAAGEAGPDVFTGPQTGGGAALTAPGFGGEQSANIASGGSDRPIRMAAAPQQVTAGSTETGARPAVNTESAAMPEIGGSELEEPDRPLGPPPPLQAGAALVDNAAAFAGDATRPLMSIILIDTGAHSDLRPRLTALTAPITFGVEAGIRDAGAVAADYRDAGFEVTAVLPGAGRLGLIEGLAEDQVAPLLARVLDQIPVAATVMGPVEGPLPGDRRMANALLDSLTVTGHGLLTYRGNGLNNLPIIASEKGVPAALVYRVIDDQPGAANIGLALERAVLDASRSGHVIVVGRVQEETVTALFSWLPGSGAREVTIAPASAVLRNTGN